MKNRPDFSPSAASTEYMVSSERAENFLYEVYGRRRQHAELSDYLELIEGEDAEFQKARFRSRWKNDERRAATIRETHDKTAGKAGLALENFLAVEIENSDWFNASVFATSDIDDYTRGVDAVLEWDPDEGDAPYQLAVDFTSAITPDVVDHKFERSRPGAVVDYYISDFDEDEPIQELSHLPRVILGVDASLLPEVARAGLQNKKQKFVPNPDKDVVGEVQVEEVGKRAYVDHPLQIVLLEQAKLQLGLLVREEAARIAKRLNRVRQELSEEMNRLLLSYTDLKGDAEAVSDIIDKIFATGDDVLESVFQEDKYLKWRNWLGCYRMVSSQLEHVLEETKTRPGDVRAYRDKSLLNAQLRRNVEKFSKEVA
ncbi:hypothetical protein HQ524_03685 [Candidatus Uhrbacteria bacterium]|nr:hypothetical protein [Candidatus Uhrbacteria bacterium]